MKEISFLNVLKRAHRSPHRYHTITHMITMRGMLGIDG